MDHHRVSRGWRHSFLALMLGVFCYSPLFASVPFLPGPAGWLTAGNFASTAAESCAMFRQDGHPGVIQGRDPWGSAYTGPPYWCKPINSWQYTSEGFGPSVCPEHSASAGNGACACGSGYEEDTSHKSCVPECKPPNAWISQLQLDGTYVSSCSIPSKCDWALNQVMLTFGTFQIERGKDLCISDCSFRLKADAGQPTESARLNASSPWMDTRTMGDFRGTGSVCSSLLVGATSPGGSAPNPDLPVNKCPPGQLPGTVNGLSVCAKSGESVEGDKKTVNKPGDPSDPKSVTSETTNNVTTCTGSGSCTTTTTVTSTHYDGTTTTATSDKTQSQSGYCAANPSANVCKGDASGAFSGVCGKPPVCSGDAVQCAVAEATFLTNCVIAGTDNDPDSVVNKALSGRDETNTGVMKAAAAGSPVNVGSFDATGQGWSRSCPADPVIVLSWASASDSQFAIPFSKLCANGLLALLSNGALALTMLGSLVFVVGGKQSAAA